MGPAPLLAHGTLAAVTALAAYGLAESWTGRLSHHDGYHLVAVEDRVGVPDPPRPRHAAVVVLDGVGEDQARSMAWVRRLSPRGQCRTTWAGPITVSRPMYATLSTGLEQDRSGARNNAETRPLATESIWDAARRAGRTTHAISPQRWWQELFPGGFTTYQETPDVLAAFRHPPTADVTLYHPLEADDAGHAHGGDSPAYAAAVAALDQALGQLELQLDLSQDLLVVTADHGHTARGGHGGVQDRVARVLTCWAGQGVTPRQAAPPVSARAVAPTLAVLLALPFPRHLRAVDDELDVAWEVADPQAFPPPYVRDRRDAVERFRAQNRRYLASVLGPGLEPSWDRLHGQGRRSQDLRAAVVALAALGVLAAVAWRRRGGSRASAWGLGWSVVTPCVAAAVLVAARGSFDITAINSRREYVTAMVTVGVVTCLAAFLVHGAVRRSWDALLTDAAGLNGALLVVNLGHSWAYGWVLGYPVPSPQAVFFPFFGALLQGVLAAGVGLMALGLAAWRSRPAQGARPGSDG
jgi:hypothetical protein